MDDGGVKEGNVILQHALGHPRDINVLDHQAQDTPRGAKSLLARNRMPKKCSIKGIHDTLPLIGTHYRGILTTGLLCLGSTAEKASP